MVGVTGYAGAELARLLLRHPRLQGKPPVFAGRVDAKDEARGGIPLAEIHPQLAGQQRQRQLKAASRSPGSCSTRRGVEVLFLATPHEQSREWVPEALERGLRVIDLSGAWRLTDAANRAVYHFEDEGTAAGRGHAGAGRLRHAGAASRADRDAQLVANPGCYATSVILALRPLVAAGIVDLDRGIVADSKERRQRRGQSAHREDALHVRRRQSLRLRRLHPSSHRRVARADRHRRERDRLHAAPAADSARHSLHDLRAFQASADARKRRARSIANFSRAARWCVSTTRALPQIQYSVRTNYADIGFQLAPDGRRAVIVSCLDNLLKGASGQAVQNLNVMLGWHEAEGLE